MKNKEPPRGRGLDSRQGSCTFLCAYGICGSSDPHNCPTPSSWGGFRPQILATIHWLVLSQAVSWMGSCMFETKHVLCQQHLLTVKFLSNSTQSRFVCAFVRWHVLSFPASILTRSWVSFKCLSQCQNSLNYSWRLISKQGNGAITLWKVSL